MNKDKEIEVLILSEKYKKEWMKFVKTHPNSCIYHTLEWGEILEDSFSHKNVSLIAMENGEVKGILPLFLIKYPLLGKKLVSIPFDTEFGGPLCYEEEVGKRLIEEARNYAINQNVKYLEIRNANPISYVENEGFVEKKPVFHTRLTLTTVEENWNKMVKNHRVAVKQSWKRGVETFIASEYEHMNLFYEELLKFFKSVGSPIYPKNFFLNIYSKLKEKNMMQLVIAKHKDNIIGYTLLLCYKDKVIYRFGVVKQKYLQLRPYNALIWRAIEWAIQSKYKLFTFGYTYPSQRGLLKFKEGWGAINKRSHHYYFSVSGNIPSFEKQYDSHSFAKKTYQKLPLTLTKFIGGEIRKWVC